MRKFFRKLVLRWKLELLDYDYHQLDIDISMYGTIDYTQYKLEKDILDQRYDKLKAELDSL